MRVAKPGKQLQTIKLSLYIAKIVRVAKQPVGDIKSEECLYIAKIVRVAKRLARTYE